MLHGAVADPDLEIKGRWGGGGGGGGAVIQTLRKEGGRGQIFFGPSGLSLVGFTTAGSYFITRKQ